MKNKLPSYIIVTIVGLLLVVEYFFNVPFVSTIASEVKNWGVVLGAGAIILGIVNIIAVNLRSLRTRKSDVVSIILLFAFLAIFATLGISQGTESSMYQKLYTSMYVPMATTIFSMKIFYMLSAAYRSFTARRVEAGIMLGISVIVLVTVVPLGEKMFPFAPSVLSWLQNVPNVAGQRGILLGAALGSFMTALRTILGLERGNIGL